MEIVKKVAKSLLIGSLVGFGIAIFTSYFFSDLIDRMEYLTYYMRYHWEYNDLTQSKLKEINKKESDVCIIDIDDRSQQKMGWYANWNRSYHARLLKTLNKRHPAAILFDINFYDPEDHHHATRLNELLERSRSVSDRVNLSEEEKQAIINTIDYDGRFVDAVKECGNVYNAIRLSSRNDYVEGMLSQVEHKMTREWHESLNPSSAVSIPVVPEKYPIESKPIIDGIFKELANASAAIGHVNVPPNEDGVVREIPLMLRFGKTEQTYLPVSVRTVASLFGTPNEEIDYRPGTWLDIGKPFKMFCSDSGVLSASYPHVSAPMIRLIMEQGKEILSLKAGESLELTTMAALSLDDRGLPAIEMYAGYFPAELLAVLADADLEPIIALPTGEEHALSDEVTVLKDSDVDYILSAPWGDMEYYLSTIDMRTLDRISREDLSLATPGKSTLLYYPFTAINNGTELVSTIPVLRGTTLRELCNTRWETIEELRPGTRMDFGRAVRIPLTHDNKHIITFFGPKKVPFTYYSYYDIMNDRIHAPMEGKIFVVGSSAPSMFDLVHAPLDKVYPGVEVHASLINSFLANTFITRLENWQNLIILLLIGVIIGFFSYILKPLPGAIVTILSVFAYFLIAMSLFGNDHLWIDIARPVLTIILTFTAVMAYRYITEEKDRKFLQSTFKQYLSPELIDQMYQGKQSPKLGGDEGIRTAYFTDIQSFSTFSEKLGSPTRLVELLNEYLTAMTDILLGRFGTLDKYEGDAIIAFFGAPMPMDDHALQACLTALDMQKKLGELRRKWVDEGDKWPRIVHEMRMRIGINTGAITTGNMGSAVRMNYTMMGDAVNLAARLESAAKQYGVYSMISQYTWDLVKDALEVRQVDKIKVVGKSEPVVVYELIAEKGHMSPAYTELLEHYNRGLELFYDQQWDRALEALGESEKLEPLREVAPKQMSPSKKIMEYCRLYKETPPDPEWDGVMELTSK